jgi:phage minor structural protein
LTQIHITDGQTDQIVGLIPADSILSNVHRKSLKDTLETFDFETFADKVFSEYLGKHNRVIIPDEDQNFIEFVILEAGRYRDAEGTLRVEVYTSASYQLLKKSKVINPQVLSEYTPSTAVSFALSGTEWEPATIEGEGFRTFDIEKHTNPYSFLKQIATEFDLELRFRVETNGYKVTGRYVDLLERVGQWRGREIEFGRDLMGIKRTEKTDDIVTALVGLGPDKEDGTRLRVTVEDDEALQRWGRRNSRTGNIQHLVGIYEPQSARENMTEMELTQYCRTELNKRISEVVEYEADIADLEHVAGLENKKIRFGDTIKIKDTKFNPPLYLEARVHTQERDIVDKSKKTFELGDFTEFTEEEVTAIWRQLQAQVNAKVSFNALRHYTYSKIMIDEKDEDVRSDVESYAQTVSSNAKDEAITYTNNTVEPIISRVVSTEKDINELEFEIGSVDTRLVTAESNIEQAMDEITFKVDAGYVQGAIGDIEVGGRNYFSTSGVYSYDPHFVLSDTGKDYIEGTYQGGGSTGYYGLTLRMSNYTVEEGLDYVFSGYIYINGAPLKENTFGHTLMDRSEFTKKEYVVNEDTGYVTFKFHVETPYHWFLRARSESLVVGDVIRIEYPKLEKGNKATDWTPAPEDIDAKMADLSAEISLQAGRIDSKAEATVVTDVEARVTTAEHSIDALDGAITNKVEQTDFNSLEGTVNTLSSEVTQTAEDVQFAFSEIDEVNDKINNATTTIDGSGVTVADGSFYLKETGSNTRYSIVTKQNLVSDHSFERIPKTGSLGNDFTWATDSDSTLHSYTRWIKQGNPRLMSVWGTDGFMSVFGYQSAVVNSSNYFWQSIGWLRPGKTYTLSAHFFITERSTAATPRLRAVLKESFVMEENILETWNETFSVLSTSNGSLRRHSMTFTIPNDAPIDNTLIIEARAGGSGWLGIDGMQLVEGETPTLYDSEDTAFISQGEPGQPVSHNSINVNGTLYMRQASGNNNNIDLGSGNRISLYGDYLTLYFYSNSGSNGIRFRNPNGNGDIMQWRPDGTWRVDRGNLTTTSSSANMRIFTGDSSSIARIAIVSSRRELKRNIEPIDITDEQLMSLNPVSFIDKEDYRENGEKAKLQIGLIAEEVAESKIPQLADKDEEGTPLSVEYGRVGIALLPVVQRLINRVDELEAKLTDKVD